MASNVASNVAAKASRIIFLPPVTVPPSNLYWCSMWLNKVESGCYNKEKQLFKLDYRLNLVGLAIIGLW